MSDEITDYRITQLEKSNDKMAGDISIIKENVIEIHTKISEVNGEGLKCHVHADKISVLESGLTETKNNINSLNKFKWQVLTIGTVIILLAQVFSSVLVDKIFHNNKQSSSPPPIVAVSPIINGNQTNIIK